MNPTQYNESKHIVSSNWLGIKAIMRGKSRAVPLNLISGTTVWGFKGAATQGLTCILPWKYHGNTAPTRSWLWCPTSSKILYVTGPAKIRHEGT